MKERRFALIPLLAASLLASSLLGCAQPSQDPEPEPTPAPRFGPVARDLSINQVTLNQGVAVALMREGEAVSVRNAPLVAGRPGLLRVFVVPESGWEEREVLGELVLETGGSSTVLRSVATLSATSLSGELDSTLNFTLDGALLAPDTRFSVAVRELGGAPNQEVGAVWPAAEGELTSDPSLDDALVLPRAPLGASDWGGVVRVQIIPVRYDTDGSGRLPDTSAEQLELLASWLQRLYPVRQVELTVGEVYATELPFDSTSDPMSDLLQEISQLRATRGIPFDTYAYAMVNPAPSYEDYCGSGCTAGIAYRVANPNTAWLRSGVGLGYEGERSAQTMAHEVGHNHDRGHAPCGNVGNPDLDFPYPNGGLGVWGYDLVRGELKDPGEHADVMGYCDPRWISDYQFAALWERLAAVEGLSPRSSPEAWQVVSLRRAGARLDSVWTLEQPPDGEPVPVTLRDADGAVLDVVQGVRQDIEDAETATLLLPPLGDEVASIEVQGLVVER